MGFMFLDTCRNKRTCLFHLVLVWHWGVALRVDSLATRGKMGGRAPWENSSR